MPPFSSKGQGTLDKTERKQEELDEVANAFNRVPDSHSEKQQNQQTKKEKKKKKETGGEGLCVTLLEYLFFVCIFVLVF